MTATQTAAAETHADEDLCPLCDSEGYATCETCDGSGTDPQGATGDEYCKDCDGHCSVHCPRGCPQLY